MHQTRKIIAVGASCAVIIPPHICDHLNASKGDFLIWDDRYPLFALVTKAVVPPLAQITIDFPHLSNTATEADTAAHPAAPGSPPEHCGPRATPITSQPRTEAQTHPNNGSASSAVAVPLTGSSTPLHNHPSLGSDPSEAL